MGKQATPRSVQAYSSGFTEIFQRFANYIESAKDENDVISDITSPIKLLFVESKLRGASPHILTGFVAREE